MKKQEAITPHQLRLASIIVKKGSNPRFFLGLILLGIACLFVVQSCAPVLKLNQSSGLVQTNQNLEIRAFPKKFKSKNGPVEINWFVNGEKTASGGSYIFKSSTPGEYVVRAEATQKGKRAEREIRLETTAFNTRLINLINGIENLPSAPGKPISETNSTSVTLPEEIKKEGNKQTRTVWAEEKKSYSGLTNPDEFVMFDPNANVLWPGALVQGKSVADGVPSIIPIGETHRLPGKVTLSIVSGDGKGVANKFYRETEMTKSAITQAMNEILGGYAGGTPGQYAFSKSIVHSASHIQAALDMGYSGPVHKINGKLSVDWQDEKTRMVVKLHQKFFTMAYDDPQGVEGVFRPSISYNDIAPYAGAGNPVCYISSVTYGRIFVLLYESTLSELDLKASLNYAYDGAIAEGYAKAKLETNFKNGSITVKAFQVGGDPSLGLDVALDPMNPEKLQKFIAGGAKFSAQNPGEIISYSINHLKDASLVRMNSAIEYTVTQRKPISTEEYIEVPAVTNRDKQTAEALLRKDAFTMKITQTVEDCSKNTGTVVKQSPAAGELVQAGSTVNVSVVQDRPVVKAKSIPGTGKFCTLKPGESCSENAWASGATDVKFSLEGDKCSEGEVYIKHPSITAKTVKIKSGELKDERGWYHAGTITINFQSKDPNALLHVRIW